MKLDFGLTRKEDDQGWRWYDCGGKEYISVTKSMDHVVPEKLKTYMQKNSFNKQQKTLTQTASTGNRIHEMAQNDLMGIEDEIDPSEQIIWENWLKVKEEGQIKADAIETLVYHPKIGYAGAVDIIGTYKGMPAIFDIKTGWYGVKAGYQMAAYKYALEYLFSGGFNHPGNGFVIRDAMVHKNLKLREGDILAHKDIEFSKYLKPSPEFKMVGIQLHRDGRPGKIFEYAHPEWCWHRYLECLGTFKGIYFHQLKKKDWTFLMENHWDHV